VNQRRWGLPLGGIKSSLEIVFSGGARQELSVLDERIESEIPNRWYSCMEGARTKNMVSARDLQEVRRKRCLTVFPSVCLGRAYIVIIRCTLAWM